MLTQFLPTGFALRSLSSLSAISRTSAFKEGSLQLDSLSIRSITASSSSFIRRFAFGSQSRRERVPSRQRRIVRSGTL